MSIVKNIQIKSVSPARNKNNLMNTSGDNDQLEFTNEDLLDVLESRLLTGSHSEPICFALYRHNGNEKRVFLTLEQLCNIRGLKKNQQTSSLWGLQLLKIPPRVFTPYFYYHYIDFKGTVMNGQRIMRHSTTELAHHLYQNLIQQGTSMTAKLYAQQEALE